MSSSRAIVSYLGVDHQEQTELSKVTEMLWKTLEKYRLNQDQNELGRAFQRYLDQEEWSEFIPDFSMHNIARGLGTFNIAPSNSYDRYLSVVQNRSDIDAVQSDWDTIGEDLSFAYIKHILRHEKEQHDW